MTYASLLRTPFRIWLIRKLIALAAWLARPSFRGKPILEHYSLALDVKTIEGDVLTSKTISKATLLLQSYEVGCYRDAITQHDEELLKDAEAIFLGADDQGEFK